MTDPNCAALDPIFWLHHANIDRLWNDWLALGGGHANPPDAAWLTPAFAFFDENGAAVTLSSADVVDSAAQLGYVYDNAPVPSLMEMTASPPPPQPPPGPPELVAASEQAVELAGAPASVSLTAAPSTRALLEAGGEAPQRVLVSVEDIEAEEDPGLAYAVYLEPPGGEERRHVGNVTFFGVREMNDPDTRHEGAPGFRHTFDATDAVGELQALEAWDPGSIQVIFEPITVLPPPGQELAPEAQPAATAPTVTIGRVSMFIG